MGCRLIRAFKIFIHSFIHLPILILAIRVALLHQTLPAVSPKRASLPGRLIFPVWQSDNRSKNIITRCCHQHYVGSCLNFMPPWFRSGIPRELLSRLYISTEHLHLLVLFSAAFNAFMFLFPSEVWRSLYVSDPSARLQRCMLCLDIINYSLNHLSCVLRWCRVPRASCSYFCNGFIRSTCLAPSNYVLIHYYYYYHLD